MSAEKVEAKTLFPIPSVRPCGTRRTNVMLASISFAFCFSWFPLNFFCVIADSTDLTKVIELSWQGWQFSPSYLQGVPHCRSHNEVDTISLLPFALTAGA